MFIYYLLSERYRIAFLALLSCGFIASFSFVLLTYVLIYTFVNYIIGKKLKQVKNIKFLFRVGIIFNLLQLILLKYASFAIDPFFSLFKSEFELSSTLYKVIIPIGISYFTLQGIGYLINVKMGWEKCEKNFVDFLLYITFFPKFLSGPIERSNHFLKLIKESKAFEDSNITTGLRIALIGCFKKVAIANQLAPFITDAYSNVSGTDGSQLLIVLLLQPLYLYFDFSGYTDIAIGVAKLFGIDLLPNFNRPFFSLNMTNFWKRFHISLSSWFNDYIFKQTLFRRRKWGEYAPVYALLVTWVLFGIWHGAGWSFMVLGFIQAIAIIYEYYTRMWRARLFKKYPTYVRTWTGRVSTYLFYSVSLVFFYSSDLNTAFTYFSGLSEWHGFTMHSNHLAVLLMSLSFITIFMTIEFLQNDYPKTIEKIAVLMLDKKKKSQVIRWGFYFFLVSVIIVLNNEVQDFIYFQF